MRSSDPITLARALAAIGQRRRSKYGAIAVEVDGVRFASRREARRYRELRILSAAGEIRDLELQPVFRIEIDGRRICDYIGDFRYQNVRTGETVTEDAKGVRTAIYRLKKKLVAAVHGVVVREV